MKTEKNFRHEETIQSNRPKQHLFMEWCLWEPDHRTSRMEVVERMVTERSGHVVGKFDSRDKKTGKHCRQEGEWNKKKYFCPFYWKDGKISLCAQTLETRKEQEQGPSKWKERWNAEALTFRGGHRHISEIWWKEQEWFYWKEANSEATVQNGSTFSMKRKALTTWCFPLLCLTLCWLTALFKRLTD